MSKRLIGMFWLGCLTAWPATVWPGAWTLPQGKLWSKVAFFQQSADEWYLANREFSDGEWRQEGDRVAYRFNGEYDSKAVFIEVFYGITDRLDLGVQIPYFDQFFSDDTRAVPPSEAGFSDMRRFVKWRALQKPVLFTLKAGAKMPTGRFENEDGLIPVGEGQWDFDFVGQLGRSFWPLPLYGNVDVGYRVRMENIEIDRDPGDEWFLTAELGYNITRRALLTGKFEMLRSDPSIEFGLFENSSQIKRITYFNPSLVYGLVDDTALEFGGRLTLNGRNFPAGHQLTMGLFSNLGTKARQPGSGRFTTDVRQTGRSFLRNGSLGVGAGIPFGGTAGVNADTRIAGNLYLSGGLGTPKFAGVGYSIGAKCYVGDIGNTLRFRVSAYYGTNAAEKILDHRKEVLVKKKSYTGLTTGYGLEWIWDRAGRHRLDLDLMSLETSGLFDQVDEFKRIRMALEDDFSGFSGRFRWSLGYRYGL